MRHENAELRAALQDACLASLPPEATQYVQVSCTSVYPACWNRRCLKLMQDVVCAFEPAENAVVGVSMLDCLCSLNIITSLPYPSYQGEGGHIAFFRQTSKHLAQSVSR